MLEELGVSRVINATGVLTVLGGSVIDDEVLAAMQEVAKIYVDVPELQEKAGDYLARLLHVEAAFVTSGAAAGLVLSMAACMTRGKQEDMVRLPKTDGIKRNEVVVQKTSSQYVRLQFGNCGSQNNRSRKQVRYY